jgi:hypothetical protein
MERRAPDPTARHRWVRELEYLNHAPVVRPWYGPAVVSVMDRAMAVVSRRRMAVHHPSRGRLPLVNGESIGLTSRQLAAAI